jgi:hypothetical protein
MLVYLLIQVFLCIVLTELVTELVVKSEIFKPVREVVFKLGDWFQKLFSCGYCFSVWAAVGVVLLTNTSYPLTGINVVDLGLMALVVHRSSNVLHNIIDKWTDKYYSIAHVNTDKSNE